jgi:ketosteroid isomerase-like protein
MSAAMTVERLAEFGDAWRRKDLDALMAFMTDDCEFRASVGPEPGTTFVGRAQVRRGFALMLRYDQAAEAHGGHAFVDGDLGASRWSFAYPGEDGGTVEVRGCDLYVFEGDRIRVKDAYRKVLGRIDDEDLPGKESFCAARL